MKLQFLIAVLAMSLPTLSVAPIQLDAGVDAGSPDAGVNVEQEMRKSIVDMADEIAMRLDVKSGNPTRVEKIFIASVTKPNQSAFVVFSQTHPAEIESIDGGTPMQVAPMTVKTFALFFYVRREESGFRWVILPEDFTPIETP